MDINLLRDQLTVLVDSAIDIIQTTINKSNDKSMMSFCILSGYETPIQNPVGIGIISYENNGEIALVNASRLGIHINGKEVYIDHRTGKLFVFKKSKNDSRYMAFENIELSFPLKIKV